MKWGVERSRFTLWIEHGLVIGSKTWSETHVSGGSSGGGGFVSGGSGYVNAPNVAISSSVRTRNAFFLKAADGKECSVDIDGVLPLRDGQVVSVIYVQRAAASTGHALIVHNHTTGEVTELPQGFDTVAGKVGCGTMIIGIVLVSIANEVFGGVAGAILGVQGFQRLTFVVAIVGAIYLLWQRSRRFKASKAQLVAEARALAKQTGAASTLEKEGA